ncbi:TPA: TonB-dependent receptor [Salmonella enterica subsp. enterica serovar Duisburg]|nr:TonB-dependent receptor [Salmonella enterica subsp. enterica serovar Duisburg]
MLQIMTRRFTLYAYHYTFTDSRQLNGENKGAPLSYTPKHVANIRLDWQTTPDIMTWLKIQYRGKSPRFTQTYSHLTPVQKAVYDARGESLKASTVADIAASWKAMKNLTITNTDDNSSCIFKKFTSRLFSDSADICHNFFNPLYSIEWVFIT